MRSWIVIPILIVSCKGDAPAVAASNWPDADALFHADPRWLGADGAYSVDLGGDRTLWLFGDTFLASHPGGTRADAYFLRNSVAIQTGRDPSNAFMAFYWGADANGNPQSFVEQDGDDWFWPGGGARIGESLILFYGRIATPSGDPSGFQEIGWRALIVDDLNDEPSAWTIHDATIPDTGDLHPGNGVLLDGDELYAYAEKNDTWHDVYLVRWLASSAARGDLSSPEWWSGGSWSESRESAVVVVPAGAPELSVQADGVLAPFVMVQTEGFGAATLALRTAPAPEGPWSGPQTFFRPPESHEGGGQDVYAGKAHPGLTGADLIATYVASSLYYPRFVRVSYR